MSKAKHCPRCGALHNGSAALCLMCERGEAIFDDTSRDVESFKQRLDAADAKKELTERAEEMRRKAEEAKND